MSDSETDDGIDRSRLPDGWTVWSQGKTAGSSSRTDRTSSTPRTSWHPVSTTVSHPRQADPPPRRQPRRYCRLRGLVRHPLSRARCLAERDTSISDPGGSPRTDRCTRPPVRRRRDRLPIALSGPSRGVFRPPRRPHWRRKRGLTALVSEYIAWHSDQSFRRDTPVNHREVTLRSITGT